MTFNRGEPISQNRRPCFHSAHVVRHSGNKTTVECASQQNPVFRIDSGCTETTFFIVGVAFQVVLCVDKTARFPGRSGGENNISEIFFRTGKEGILIKGSNYLEALAKVDTIVMDKTGTLTKGTFSLQEIHPVNISPEIFLCTLAHVEFLSNHPIAKSVVASYEGDIDETAIENMKESPGKGILRKTS